MEEGTEGRKAPASSDSAHGGSPSAPPLPEVPQDDEPSIGLEAVKLGLGSILEKIRELEARNHDDVPPASDQEEAIRVHSMLMSLKLHLDGVLGIEAGQVSEKITEVTLLRVTWETFVC